MTIVIAPAQDICEAWHRTLAVVQESGGTALHVVTTVTDPSAWGQMDAGTLSAFLSEKRSDVRSVETVASTIFPKDLYRHQPSWCHDLDEQTRTEIDEAATELFDDYADMLPTIASDPSSTWNNTYFGRMMAWPETDPPRNQLAWCIKYLRTQLRGGAGQANSADIAIAGEGELSSLQIHKSNEGRYFGGPCLVHLDLSVHNDKLNLLATYRHWHLVERALGNLLGLARLLGFLSEQTGYPIGELTVVSGMANAQRKDYGGRAGIDRLLQLTALASPADIRT